MGDDEEPDKWEREIKRTRSAQYSPMRAVPRPRPSDLHVRSNREGGWSVERGDGEGTSYRFATQREAIEKARELIGEDGSGSRMVAIHGRDGQIRDAITRGPRRKPKDNG